MEQECQQLLATVDSSSAKPQEMFMTAASPGIVALTMANRYYASHEDYVFALAGELRKEYEIIVRSGAYLAVGLSRPRHGTPRLLPG